MKKDEMRIYYGNYAIENGLLPKTLSNEIQLKVLLLLSNRVLIPPTHFLKMSNENLEELSGLKAFFDEGYICTTLYQGFDKITDYLRFKIENDAGYRYVYNYRLEKLEDFFESEKSVLPARDSRQGGEFSSILLDQIEEYKKTVNSSKLEKELLNEEKYIYELLANSQKGFLYKAEVENNIASLSDNRQISRKLYRDSLILIDRSYFLAGAISNDSILSFSPHYDEIGLPFDYGNRKVTDQAYSTEFFIMVLKALGVIDVAEDIDLLSVSDILYLKSTKAFETFIREYARLCDIVNGNGFDGSLQDSRILGRKQKNLIWWNRLSKCLIALAALPIDMATGLMDGGKPIPIYTMLAACLAAFCSKSRFDQLFEKNAVDKISVGLSKRVDAFSHFCLLLKEKLEKDGV